VTECTFLEFDVETLTVLVATQITVSTSINLELTRRLEDVYATVGDSAFGSLRQRVIRHLLALAAEITPGDGYVARITQQQIADAIGSSREVVARLMTRMRNEDLIRTGPGEIRLLNVERLAANLSHWQTESPY
jgi:CRP/FNR family transcriptional regulator